MNFTSKKSLALIVLIIGVFVSYNIFFSKKTPNKTASIDTKPKTEKLVSRIREVSVSNKSNTLKYISYAVGLIVIAVIILHAINHYLIKYEKYRAIWANGNFENNNFVNKDIDLSKLDKDKFKIYNYSKLKEIPQKIDKITYLVNMQKALNKLDVLTSKNWDKTPYLYQKVMYNFLGIFSTKYHNLMNNEINRLKTNNQLIENYNSFCHELNSSYIRHIHDE